MKRKNAIRRIVTLMLCMVIALTAANLQTASAAAKKIPLKVTFNGKNGKKTVTIAKDLNESLYDKVKIKTLKSKWGKTKEQKEGEGYPGFYLWKKGKTTIGVAPTLAEDGYVGSVLVDIKDKNGSLCGIKVGMDKDKAIEKLKSLSVGQEIEIKAKKIFAYPGGSPLTVSIKDGKVTSIFWFRS